MRVKSTPVRNAGAMRLGIDKEALKEKRRSANSVPAVSQLHAAYRMLFAAHLANDFPLSTADMKERYGFNSAADHGHVICTRLCRQLKVIHRVGKGTYVLAPNAFPLFDKLLDDSASIFIGPWRTS
jgi:hypothetical protein